LSRDKRLPGDRPTHTPRADPMQAWSAAAVPFMVSELLGLQVDGFAKAVTVRRPLLPDGVDRLELHDIQVRDVSVALSFTRSKAGSDLAVLSNPGGAAVKVLP
jgi:hypothetical protein